MIREIDEAAWKKLICKKNENSIFFDPDFLNIIASSFSYKLHYIVFEENEDVLLYAALFSRNNNIVVPLCFTYASIRFSDKISDRKYLIIFKEFLDYLKNRWRRIAFRLPVELNDIRPFLWGGFKVENRYTYIKNSDFNVHKSVSRNLRKAEECGLVCNIDFPTLEIIQGCIESMKKQTKRKSLSREYLTFFTFLSQAEKLISFNAYLNNELISSSLLLLDNNCSTAYALIIKDSDHKYARSFLYKKREEWCAKSNIQYIDFCGANSEGVANFKSYFYPKLYPYYLVSYSPFKSFLRQKISSFKDFIRAKLAL